MNCCGTRLPKVDVLVQPLFVGAISLSDRSFTVCVFISNVEFNKMYIVIFYIIVRVACAS